jgi:hypothetical protein
MSAASSPPFSSIRAPCYAGSFNAEHLGPGRKPNEQGRTSCSYTDSSTMTIAICATKPAIFK